MDENLSEMLKGVLSDPDAMSKIMGAAQGLMGSSATPEARPKESNGTASTEDTVPTVTHVGKTGNEERIALISALKPYLSSKRRENADSLIKMLKMMKLADMSKLFKN